jgi:hypothetical protein
MWCRIPVRTVERVLHCTWLLHHRSRGSTRGLPGVVACGLARSSIRIIV